MTDELVNVLVPRRHLSRVYALIGQLDGVPTALDSAVAVQRAENGNGPNLDEWTPSRLRRMVRECDVPMRGILRVLASRSGHWLSSQDLAGAIQGKPDADWNTVAGTLGAFGRRIRSRYKLETWPFAKRYDRERRGKTYQMDSDMARQILQLLDSEA